MRAQLHGPERQAPPQYATYVSMSLVFDLASALPWDLVVKAGGGSGSSVWRGLPIWRGLSALRLLRALRLGQYSSALHSALAKRNVRVPRMTWLLGKLALGLVFLTHLVACCWWRLGA